MVVRNPTESKKTMISAMLLILFSDLLRLNVRHFLVLMNEMNRMHDHIIMQGLKKRDRIYIWELKDTALKDIKINTIPCRFYGGPPQHKTVYQGTLLTVLIDRILERTIVYQDYTIFDRIASKEFDS